MANEISIAESIQNNNPACKYSFVPTSLQVTQTNPGVYVGTVGLTTSEADLSIGTIGTPGIVRLTNLDGTQTIALGPKSAGAMVEVLRLLPGEDARFRVGSGVTLRAKAIAGTPKLKVELMEA